MSGPTRAQQKVYDYFKKNHWTYAEFPRQGGKTYLALQIIRECIAEDKKVIYFGISTTYNRQLLVKMSKEMPDKQDILERIFDHYNGFSPRNQHDVGVMIFDDSLWFEPGNIPTNYIADKYIFLRTRSFEIFSFTWKDIDNNSMISEYIKEMKKTLSSRTFNCDFDGGFLK